MTIWNIQNKFKKYVYGLDDVLTANGMPNAPWGAQDKI